MCDLELLCGLDDYEALRLSTIGQDPDQSSRRPVRQRVCFKKIVNERGERLEGLNEIGQSVPKNAADIPLDISTRTSSDRDIWQKSMNALIKRARLI